MIKRPADPIKQPSKVLDIQDYLREKVKGSRMITILNTKV